MFSLTSQKSTKMESSQVDFSIPPTKKRKRKPRKSRKKLPRVDEVLVGLESEEEKKVFESEKQVKEKPALFY